nr:DUF4268 domain-containing protein [Candidatus Sigynarchaeum springense]
MEQKKIIKPNYLSASELWSREDVDFTPWLAENIEFLGDALGIDLEVEDTEVRQPDDFRADIVAKDAAGNLVVIENQYGTTDHKHLGQVLVYLTSLGAKVAVWVCETASQSHIDVIDWLNQNSSPDTGFYLVQVKVLKVQDTFTPIFEVIARPSEVSKDIGTYKQEISGRPAMFVEFWTQFIRYCQGKTDIFKNATPPAKTWMRRGVFGTSGVTIDPSFKKGAVRNEIYITTGDKERNKKIFDALHARRDEIDTLFRNAIKDRYKGSLAWQRLDDKDACRIKFDVPGIDCYSEENRDETWQKAFDFFIATSIALKDTFTRFLADI